MWVRAAFLLLVGCSEYEVGKEPDLGLGNPTHTGGTTGDDDDVTTGDDDDTTTDGDDTVPGGTTPGGGQWQPNPGDDPCFEPEDGFTQNPAARLVVEDGNEPILVTYEGSDAGYDQALVLDLPETLVLAHNRRDPDGTTIVVGPYPAGEELLFGDEVDDTGDHWLAGPGTRNSDGEIHGAVTYLGACEWRIGFEDTAGGGDRDYNDILMRVQGHLFQEQ